MKVVELHRLPVSFVHVPVQPHDAVEVCLLYTSRAEREEEQGNAYQTGGASSSFFTLTACDKAATNSALLIGGESEETT